jgi:hypothetical protein
VALYMKRILGVGMLSSILLLRQRTYPTILRRPTPQDRVLIQTGYNDRRMTVTSRMNQ